MKLSRGPPARQTKDDMTLASRVPPNAALRADHAPPLIEPVAKAMAAGIPVIALDLRVIGDRYTCCIGADNRLIGRESAGSRVNIHPHTPITLTRTWRAPNDCTSLAKGSMSPSMVWLV
jgi:hypothetical protein